MTSKAPSPLYSPSSLTGMVASEVGETRPSTLASSLTLWFTGGRGYRLRRSGVLDHRGQTLPHPDAQRGQPIPSSAAPQLMDQGRHQARAGAAQRMAQCDRPPVHVEALFIDPQLAHAGQHLG